MISEYISKLEQKIDLTYDQMNEIMSEVLSGKTTDDQNMNFLSNLSIKGETDDELLGMLDKMQELSLKITPKNKGTIIDMCGTGGDNLQTFNILLLHLLWVLLLVVLLQNMEIDLVQEFLEVLIFLNILDMI